MSLSERQEAQAEDQYAEAIDNILTGDIHLVPPAFLFSQVEKFMDDWKRSMIEDICIYDYLKIKTDRIEYLLKEPLSFI